MQTGPGTAGVLLVMIFFSTGCLSAIFPDPVVVTPTPAPVPEPVPTTENPYSTIPVSQMALLPADLPGDYILKERADLTYLETDTISRDLGWKAGYFVSYYRMNPEKYDMTVFSQTTGLYSLTTMNIVFNEKKNDALLLENDTIKIYVMPCRKLGDNTFAYKMVDEKLSVPINRYTIMVTRKDVYEELTMLGTTTDYEKLKELAATAVDKIR
jgi:hypothetical protein